MLNLGSAVTSSNRSGFYLFVEIMVFEHNDRLVGRQESGHWGQCFRVPNKRSLCRSVDKVFPKKRKFLVTKGIWG